MSKLYVVGIGPGGREGMTLQAIAALESCDLLCGYTEYIKLVSPWFPGVETLETPMMREVERCRLALDHARRGKTVAMVCSGDAGVYGMAGPLLEMGADEPGLDIEVVPGVTAASSGAAVLGAPLMHDFAVISLSDLLTPWPVIEKRLLAAGQGDFCVCLYNPRSKKRKEHLTNACDLLLQNKKPETPCGWVRNIGRDQQAWGILTLRELRDFEADMFTTLYIGNSQTRVCGGRLVTPRGYEELV